MALPTNCQSCDAEIIWAVTASGAPAPYDLPSTDSGEWILAFGDDLKLHSRHAKPEDVRAGTPRYVSHFATCPDAERWRGNPRKTKEAS